MFHSFDIVHVTSVVAFYHRPIRDICISNTVKIILFFKTIEFKSFVSVIVCITFRLFKMLDLMSSTNDGPAFDQAQCIDDV
jgi:hypothetical protein